MCAHAVWTKKQKAQGSLAKIVFWALGRAFHGCSKYDEPIKEEINQWEDKTAIMLSVPGGPRLILQKQDGVLKRVKAKNFSEEPHIIIFFKSIESAVMVLTGQLGVWQAYAQHRFTLKGDIFFSMSIIRCMDRIENYLFPPFMSKKILRRRPKKDVSSLRVYLSVLFGV